MLKNLSDWFKKELNQSFLISRYNVFAVAIVGCLGHPAYWIWWTYFDPKPEILSLRVVGFVTSLSLFTFRYWPKKLSKVIPVYWFFVACYNLPFFFTIYLIHNQFSVPWLMAEVGMMLFISSIIHQRSLLFLNVILGFTTAVLYCFLLSPEFIEINYRILVVDYFPVFVFAIVVGLSLSKSYVRGLVESEKKSARSVAASIAHELRNPLSAVNLAATRLPDLVNRINDFELKQEIDQIDSIIFNSIKQANNTINIILADLSEKPVTQDQLSLFKTERILPEVIDSFGYKTLDEKVRVNLDVGHPENNFVFLASPERFAFIVYNLLKNALYYSKEYPDLMVTVGCEKRKFDNREWNVIYVHDNGPGIPPQIISKLFGDFFTSGKKEGTGLGLAFCKRNMEIFGGKIICESEYGGENNKNSWAKFSLLFPVLSQEEVSKAEIEDRRKKILLVDDQKTNLIATRSRIEKFLTNISCDTALSGEEAIKMIRENRYHLILLDIQMPGIDGVEVSKRIRNLRDDTPIIAFTSLERNEFDLSAFNYYLSKNDDNQSFYRNVSKWLTDLEDSFSYLGSKEQYSQVLRGKKIILADDQQVNRMMTRKVLENNGLVVSEVSDGKELLELYEKTLDQNGKSIFDLILTDISMPPFNGDEAVKQIRKLEAKNNIPHRDEMPIIAISGDGQREDIHYFFRCQMTDYFIKGTNPEILIKIIANYLTKKTDEQQLDQTLDENQLLEIEQVACKDFLKKASSPKVLDLSRISSFEKCDQLEIMRIFIEETNKAIDLIRESKREGHDLKEVSFLLHSIKGTSANIGAEKLHAYVQEIELIFGRGKLPNNQNWLEDLEIIYREFTKQIKSALK